MVLSAHSTHICTCLKCGFHAEGVDDVECSLRTKHSGLCGDCADGFILFSDIFSFYDKVKKVMKESGKYDADPILQDDMEMWNEDITQCMRNFLDYRRHIAQAEDENKFDQEFYSNLKDDEAIVIMDFKMKINASMYREKQKDWFSKRGFSCLGAMIIFGSSKESSENKIMYHIFFSDDTTQDGIYVNIAKE